MAQKFNSIAFLKLCCPGDLLFTTPAIRAVKRAFPDARLFYLTGSYSRFITEHNPHVDKTLIIEPPFAINEKFAPFKSFFRGVSVIAGNHFDLIISFHRAKAIGAMAFLGKAGKVAGFDTARPLVNSRIKFDPNRHEILRYLDLVDIIGAKPVGEVMEYLVTPEEDDQCADLLKRSKVPKRFAVVAPGGGENPGTTMHIKRWPAEYFKDICGYLRIKHNMPMVAVGSESEKVLCQSIGADYNLAGLTKFPGLGPIFKKAEIVIGNDSGPLYLASAVGTKTVGIYGPSSAKLVAPLTKNHRSVSFPIWCQPCYQPQTVKRGVFTCHTGTWDCMKKLEPESIKAAIDELLNVQDKRI